MKFILAAAVLTVCTASVAVAQAPATPAATAPAAVKFSTQTKIGALAADPAAKAVLEKYIPQVVAHPQFGDAAEMTLPDLTQYVPELTPDLLKKIDDDLAKLS